MKKNVEKKMENIRDSSLVPQSKNLKELNELIDILSIREIINPYMPLIMDEPYRFLDGYGCIFLNSYLVPSIFQKIIFTSDPWWEYATGGVQATGGEANVYHLVSYDEDGQKCVRVDKQLTRIQQMKILDSHKIATFLVEIADRIVEKTNKR